jgi:hypothetical protein
MALAQASEGAKLVIIPGTGHELAYLPQCQLEILKWLAPT